MNTQAQPAPWQRGFDLAELKSITAVFAEHDEGLVHGAFTKVSELQAAEWLEKERLRFEADDERGLLACVAFSELEAAKPVKDFTGAVRCGADPGDVWVKRVGFREGHVQAALGILLALRPSGAGDLFGERKRLWAELFLESPADMMLADALGLTQVCTKIPASSELIGVFCSGTPELRSRLWPADEEALVKLPLSFDPAPLLAELEALELSFEQHYSSKNKRGSWQALALRGYAPSAASSAAEADPSFIAKPSEMAKKWKRENLEKLDWVLRDTPLRAALPSFEIPLRQLPGKPHRIRLMRLAPGGGELARHADITDPDAGMGDGQLVRVHFPLVTNPGVRFEAWLLSGEKQEAHMAAGEAWVLDTRKPHTAVNSGEEERIHLVVDCESGPELRALIGKGERP